MKELFLDGLVFAYVGAGIICCLAYYPTISDLYYHKKTSVNTTTYALWTITALITLLYSIFISQDNLFRIISLINLIACSLVLFLSLKLVKARRSKTDKEVQTSLKSYLTANGNGNRRDHINQTTLFEPTIQRRENLC